MKKFIKIIAVFLILSSFSGCTLKSEVYNSAEDTLSRIEAITGDIADDVEKLDDEYTLKVFQKISEEAKKYRELLDNGPSRAELEDAEIVLARLEKELNSVKVLASGMEDYTPELTFDFMNNTDKIISEITLETANAEAITGFSGALAPGTYISITYPVEDGTWNITASMDDGDKVTGEDIALSTISTLTLNSVNGKYEYTTK